jgi:thiol-disulfide isomerase/thioredoxin
VRKILIRSTSRLAFALPLLAFAACAPAGGTSGEGSVASAPAPSSRPSIEVVGFEALDAALAARRGEGFLLNFWAIWCPPCVAEMPELVETAHAWRERGGSVVGVSYDLMIPGVTADEVVEQMRAFTQERGIDIPVLIYDDADYERINERFALPGEVPVTLAIDRAGNVVDRHEGQADRARFDELMRKALGE